MVGWRDHLALDRARATDASCFGTPSAQDQIALGSIALAKGFGEQHRIARDPRRVADEPRIERDNRPT